MKSNQERSNECLPPKKREIQTSTLLMQEKPVLVTPAVELQRAENLAWLASVASGQEGGRQRSGTPAEADGPQSKLPCMSSSRQSRAPTPGPAATPLAAAYPPTMSQPGGTIQYAQLQPGLHLIGPPYGAPYAGYVPSQLVSPATASTQQRPLLDAYGVTQAIKAEPQGHHPSPGRDSSPLPSHPSQYVQLTGSPRAVSSPQAPFPLHLHSHPVVPQALALGASSQVVVQYADGLTNKKEDGRPREVLNGELEKGRCYGMSPGSILAKQGSGAKGSASQHQHYEARHIVLPTDYTQDTSGLRTSLMLLPNSHAGADPGRGQEKPVDKGGLCLGRPVSRTSSTSLNFPSPGSKTPHTVIQTSHGAADQLSLGLPSSGFYPAPVQPPIIGYITAGSGQQQQATSYHTNLPQHLLIPGGQPIIIPVSGGRGVGSEMGQASVTASQQFTHAPHALVAAAPPKCERLEAAYHATAAATTAAVQTQLHLPLIPASPPVPSLPSLPPYFVKGSIIQLADGALKRVEELKTEDFIQSAEISSELKIDSSTVERIDGSQAPNFAIIQFAVGEQRTQVSVEVLLEYPFFVFGQGWSSCCPERTTQLLELPCAKLSVGDVCVSLTLKNLKNGSLRKGQEPDSTGCIGLLLKPPKEAGPNGGRGGYHGEQENGLGQRVGGTGGPSSQQPTPTNGDVNFEGKTVDGPSRPKMEASSTGRPAGRKRRWSAPESRKVEKTDDELPSTLPRPSFIPQEVKISIEGRSNIGK
ncbi:ataxin-1-like [Paramormyrops kingsleyae]|uniref:ataxin-1-like n=1 Tax=Paramormyrops kingsleyae TaxID=1676925 RepID=UPI003B96FDEA